jgi:hypothetical protein
MSFRKHTRIAHPWRPPAQPRTQSVQFPAGASACDPLRASQASTLQGGAHGSCCHQRRALHRHCNMCLQYSASPAATPCAQMAPPYLHHLTDPPMPRAVHPHLSTAYSMLPALRTLILAVHSDLRSTRPKRSLPKIILPRDDAGGGFRLWRRQSKQARSTEPTRCDLEGGDILLRQHVR